MKRLAIFDFDGTLMNTPQPEWGKEMWREKKGEPYPHKGWWGRAESLDTDVFKIKPFPIIYSKLKEDVADPETKTIILTSRLEKLRPQVQNILDQNNIHVDELIMKRGGEDKGDVIMQFVKNNEDLKKIVAYDDFAGGRDKKIEEYTKIKNDLPDDIDYDIYYVKDGKATLMESSNHLLQIIREEIIKLK